MYLVTYISSQNRWNCELPSCAMMKRCYTRLLVKKFMLLQKVMSLSNNCNRNWCTIDMEDCTLLIYVPIHCELLVPTEVVIDMYLLLCNTWVMTSKWTLVSYYLVQIIICWLECQKQWYTLRLFIVLEIIKAIKLNRHLIFYYF